LPWTELRREKPLEKLSEELGAGVPTLEDIIEQLVRPGRDPRQDMPLPVLRSDVSKDGRPVNGHVLERHGSQCGRFWRFCGYRRQTGWPAAPQPGAAR
jgi:hypothetical protein